MAKKGNTPKESLSYEKAFDELEKIVAALESEKLPLEESMTLFERGQALAETCSKLLEKAELKVQTLKKNGELEDTE